MCVYDSGCLVTTNKVYNFSINIFTIPRKPSHEISYHFSCIVSVLLCLFRKYSIVTDTIIIEGIRTSGVTHKTVIHQRLARKESQNVFQE